MSCETKRKLEKNLDELMEQLKAGFENKDFKSIHDLEFLREVANPFQLEEFDIKTLKKQFKGDVHKSVVGDMVKIKFREVMKKLNQKNARKENRTDLIGLIAKTLDDPLFVMDMQNNKKERRYFAPYIDPDDNLVHIMSVTVDKGNGNYLQTHFKADMDKVQETFATGELVYTAKGDKSSQTQELGLSSSRGTRPIASLGSILTYSKNKVNKIKNSESKIDASIEMVWDTVMQGFDIGATPIKYMLGAMNKKVDPTASWFGVTDLQKQSNEVINDFRNMKASIYDDAGEIKGYLSTLSKDDSKSLVHALGGDMSPDTLSESLKPLYDRFRAVIDKNANELVELGVLAEDVKIEDYLKRYYKQYVEEGHGGSSMAYDKLKKRKDLTLDERIALGMLEDADFVISSTIAEQKIQIAKAKTLKSMADKFGSDEPIDGYIQISDESVGGGVKKWGALAGKYISPEIKKEIDYSRFVQEQTKILEDGLYPVIDHLKVNMTVKNPVTHIYNIASNMLLAGLNGDMLAVGKMLYMRAKSPDEFKALVKKANTHGLNSYLDDFETAHIELMPDGKSANPMMSIWKNLYMTQDSKLGAGARKLYDWEDKIFKLSAFKRLLDEGVEEKEAFKKAVDVYVDYSTPLPAGIRFLDKSGLMPFLHYQYKSTPATAKVIANHPIRAMIMATGVLSLGASAWQNDDEELMTPTWAKDKFNLFGVSEWLRLGNGYYINAGRMIPGTKFEFELGGFVKGAMNIINGETPLGYNINSKYDDELEKYGKRALVMAENFLPSMTLGRYMQRGVNIALGEAGLVEPKKNYYDEDMTVPELLGRSVGVRKFNEQKELNSKLRDANNLKKHQDKDPKSNKSANQKEYDAKVKRIKKVANKEGFDLSGVESDGFGFGKSDFGFKLE